MICTYVSVFICMRLLFSLYVSGYAIYMWDMWVSLINGPSRCVSSCWTLDEQDMMALIIMSLRTVPKTRNLWDIFKRMFLCKLAANFSYPTSKSLTNHPHYHKGKNFHSWTGGNTQQNKSEKVPTSAFQQILRWGENSKKWNEIVRN